MAFVGDNLLKTVEYLAHGLPSVLTAEALFGIAGGAGEAYLLAKDRAAFVAALAALLAEPDRRAAMGVAAQAFARRHFGPAALDPALADVQHRNVVRIGAVIPTGMRQDTLLVFSAIDNLVKGAAGQAVQNANIMLGLDEGAGLHS